VIRFNGELVSPEKRRHLHNGNPMSARYAILGYPVTHSVSPAMQSAAFAAAGIDATYVAISVPPGELAAAFQRLRDEGYGGWNVTVPHKEEATRLADETDEAARISGSTNTIVVRNGRLSGHSTDGRGLLTALRERFAFEAGGRAVALIGCGGAARAAAFALAAAGAARLLLVNRTAERGVALARDLRNAGLPVETACFTPADTRLAQTLAETDLLIQGTSLGLHADDPLPLPAEWIPEGKPVMDMIYRTTPFLRAAEERGCPAADGAGMLLHQGAASFTLWTGLPAPVEAMRTALAGVLERRRNG
jgi:shikimate dehydrogenase